MAGPLVIGDVTPEQRVVGVRPSLVTEAESVVMAAHGAAGAEDGEVLAVKQTEMLVISDQGASWRGIRTQHIAAKEGRGVIEAQEAEQGRRQVDLTGDRGHLPRLDETRRVDEQRDMVVGGGQILLACAAGPKSDAAQLKRLTDFVVSLDTMDSAAFTAFFQWVSVTVSSGSMSVGAANTLSLPPTPPEVNVVI